MQNAVTYGLNTGAISNGLKTQLTSTLQTAQSSLTLGFTALAVWYLNNFISQVTAAGTKITASYSALLINWTQDLIARLSA